MIPAAPARRLTLVYLHFTCIPHLFAGFYRALALLPAFTPARAFSSACRTAM